MAWVLGRSVLLLISLSFVFFALAHLVPGGICSLYPQQTLASCRSSMGLSSPVPVQYAHWIGHYLRGNLGSSPSGAALAPQILGGVPPTLLLLLGGSVVFLLAAALRIVLGARLRLPSRLASLTWPLALAVPVFWMALLVVYVFAVHWRVFPTGKIDDYNIPAFWSDSWFAHFPSSPVMMLINLVKHLVLPSVAIAFVIFVARRVAASGEAGFDAVTNQWRTWTDRLALSNLPLFVAILISGLVVVESVFAYSGLGYQMVAGLQGSPPDYARALDLLMLGSLTLWLVKVATDLLILQRERSR